MVELVTLEEVLAHLKIGADELDEETAANLQILMDAAASLVLGYVRPELALAAVALPLELPRQVKLAVLVLVAILHRNPDNDDAGAFAEGRLPPVVRAILRTLRRPICV